jgi:hypothetical protein
VLVEVLSGGLDARGSVAVVSALEPQAEGMHRDGVVSCGCGCGGRRHWRR